MLGHLEHESKFIQLGKEVTAEQAGKPPPVLTKLVKRSVLAKMQRHRLEPSIQDS